MTRDDEQTGQGAERSAQSVDPADSFDSAGSLDSARYLDPSLPIADRVQDLLDRMTLAEKVGQMLQLDARGDLGDLVLGKLAGAVLHAAPGRIDELHALVQRTRLRIPLLVAQDVIHGHSFWPGATVFGEQLALGCTFDAGLAQRVARVAAIEAASTGIHWAFSPVLCIARDPRWGRVGETFGEDPHLIAELGAAMIRGYQGQGLDDPTAVLATAKHFAGYSETQGGRDASEADLSRRKLRAWFLPPFQRAVSEGCATFMLGYQAIDGVPVTANSWLLNEVLRGEWGFRGVLVTDWDSVGRMVWEQKVCADLVEASVVAIEAGNDLAMTTAGFGAATAEAVGAGRVDEERVDEAVRHILGLKFALGLFDRPRRPSVAAQAAIGSAEHAALNLEVARRALVLLRNDGVLPLDTTLPGRRIALIGPLADYPVGQLGDWSGDSGQIDWMPEGHPRHLIETVLDGLRAVAPEDWTVSHAQGAQMVRPATPEELPGRMGAPDRYRSMPADADAGLIAEAVQHARDADHAVLVVGDHLSQIGEELCTATLELNAGQVALLDAVAATGTPMTVVAMTSKPLVLPPSALGASALIWAFSPGMRGGRAIAELVLGQIEPSGRLPISIPRHAGQLPVFYNQVRGQHGNRYADLTQEPQFAFGEGLSYSSVRYADLQVATPRVRADETIRATVRVGNAGARPALETVQVYVRDVVTSVTWADRELKAFVQVPLQPGESRLVELSVPAASCSIVDAAGNRIVEPGAFELLVGPSSKLSDLLVAGLEITG
ncbi:MAG: glycoside hydrolase family 3 N-terminal domain-containing protein [Micropruina sp.]|uniref:glycoside hydrolase family 3 N-terminal domain-containing protein n=1 Tax=Micropruina sp. TaxID=2737536 RepID=UPI0039E5108E